MHKLAAIFEKIKGVFYSTQQKEEAGEKHKFLFAPFSTGFTYDDFLFLDSNQASENSLKWYDELLEFSQIANTIIPIEERFWTLSGDQNDYLFNRYKNILDNLRLMDPDSLQIEMLYKHPIFTKALDAVDEELSDLYRPFFNFRTKLSAEIIQLKETITDSNRTVLDLEIKMKEDNLQELDKKWNSEGKKDDTEAKILEIIKDEFDWFMQRFISTKSHLETGSVTGSQEIKFYLTSCTPNNLFKGDELEWNKIHIRKAELQKLLKEMDSDKYKEVLGSAELSQLEVESINFELLFVNVTRAWFDESILNSPFWDINLLDKNQIRIPQFTSELILVRNVDIKLPEVSNKNKMLLQNKLIHNLGPFIINTSQLKEGKNLQLKSVNKSLEVERKMVFDVGAKLKAKQRHNSNIEALITKKQSQFITFSPQLKAKKVTQTFTAKPGFSTKARFRPELLRARPTSHRVHAATNRIKCKFSFTDIQTNVPIVIKKGQVTVWQPNSNSRISIKFSQEGNNSFVVILSKNKSYRLKISVEGYEPLEYHFTIPLNNASGIYQKIVRLTRIIVEVEPETEDFQLIGVISRRIVPYPNPIKGADYL